MSLNNNCPREKLIWQDFDFEPYMYMQGILARLITLQKGNMEKYNELFKTLVAAGLLMPTATGARWFGQVIARLNQEKPGWDQE